jgi:hypothetical protein
MKKYYSSPKANYPGAQKAWQYFLQNHIANTKRSIVWIKWNGLKWVCKTLIICSLEPKMFEATPKMIKEYFNA